MKHLLIYVLTGTFTQINAQEKIIKGTVTNETGRPVAYAGVGIMGTAYGTVADESGNFTFYVPKEANDKDTLKISCIGHGSFKSGATTLPEFLKVTLQSQSLELPEIAVQAKVTSIRVIGNSKEKTFMKCNFAIGNKPNQNLGSEIGRKFLLRERNITSIA